MKKPIKSIIEEFNKRFGANCKLLDIRNKEIVVLFDGNICFTCGTYDYFEDLAIMLSKEFNEEYGIEKYEQTEDGKYIVYFKPKKEIKELKRDIKVILYI